MPANTFSHSTGIARLKEWVVSLKAYLLSILALRKRVLVGMKEGDGEVSKSLFTVG